MAEKWTFPELEYKRPDTDGIKNQISELTTRVKEAKSFEELLQVYADGDKLTSMVQSVNCFK